MQVLDELSVQSISGIPMYYFAGQPTGGSVSFSGTVAEGLPVGTVGIAIFLTIELQELVGEEISLPAISLMKAGKQAIVGVTIPEQFGDICVEPSLDQLANLYDTEQAVTFVKAGMGSITFEPGLTGQNFLESNLADYFDLAAVSYNAETDTLMLPVYHFTRYSVGVKELDPPVKYGDIDDNGSIDASDAVLALQHVAGLSLLEGEALTRARVSGSTGPVDVGDAILILRRVTGLNDGFPVEQG